MTTPSIQQLLRYANIQMASEALLDILLIQPSNEELKQALELGNARNSKFPPTLATEFARRYTVVQHQKNTSTGFSGTLFWDLESNEYILSFRSTEFLDDAARDNQATNAGEVKPFGFAFGQIADMESWWKELNAPGGPLAAGQPVTVTGYSLGGHLATAFNLLRKEQGQQNRIAATYTFNGAGVGQIKTESVRGGSRPVTTLTGLIADFDRQRHNVDGQQIVFTNSEVQAAYQSLRSRLSDGAAPTASDFSLIINNLAGSAERDVLEQALVRMEVIAKVAARVPTLPSGRANVASPSAVPAAEIAGLQLDYQLAVLRAKEMTSPGPTVRPALFGRRTVGPGGLINGFHEVYGAAPPSAVAFSQYRYGEGVPVFIEDQPLYRGNFFTSIAIESFLTGGLKLLTPGFADIDFGDTHSIVLVVDSLSVMSALAQLDPTITLDRAKNLFEQASNLKRVENAGTQGQADGDTLESVVNALAAQLGLPGWRDLNGSGTGGTWAEPNDQNGNTGRNTFHSQLNALTSGEAFRGLVGKVDVAEVGGLSGISSSAKTDFGEFVALKTLSPFALKAKVGNADAEAALRLLWQTAHEQDYRAWSADRNARLTGDTGKAFNFSDTWYVDRAAMLRQLLAINLGNEPLVTESPSSVGQDPIVYKDIRQNIEIRRKAVDAQTSFVIFGGAAADTLQGGAATDHLYGDDGNDTLRGLGGDDRLEGGQGADSLDGGSGNDQLIGGSGADTYFFETGFGHDVITDSDADGIIRYAGQALPEGRKIGNNAWESMDGQWKYFFSAGANTPTEGTLIIQQTSSSDTITIRSFKQGRFAISLVDTRTPDTIYSPVSSYIHAFGVVTPGSDRYNRFAPTDGNDHFGIIEDQASYGFGGGNDYVWERNGQDYTVHLRNSYGITLNRPAWSGDSVIDAGEGNDVIYAGFGKDRVFGGAGNDFIFGGTPFPYHPTSTPVGVRMIGGDWKGPFDSSLTTAILSNGAWQWYLPGWFPGDPVFVDGNPNPWRQLQWTLRAKPDGEPWLPTDFAVLFSEDGGNYIAGELGNDYIVGGYSADVLDGGDDADVIWGWNGEDQINGGDGDDTLMGGSQFAEDVDGDVIDGGAGDDRLFGGGGSDVLFGGSDNDVLTGDGAYQGYVAPDTEHGNDFLDGGIGEDTLIGGLGDDLLYGGEGNDLLIADLSANIDLHGDDYLDGGAGNDELQGGGGDDDLYGGEGDDLLFGDGDGGLESLRGNDYIDGGEGDDFLAGGLGDDFLDGGDGNDTLQGGDGADTLYGESGFDNLSGDDGDDRLNGGDDFDVLTGGAGQDVLDGGTGSDLLYGGDGDDVYISDAGNDLLIDSSGNDTYHISRGVVTIEDSGGVDTLSIAGGSAFMSDVRSEGGFLVVEVGGGGPTVRIKGVMAGSGGFVSDRLIDMVRFADGSVLSAGDLRSWLIRGGPPDLGSTEPVNSTPIPAASPGRTRGEWRNIGAFAALKADGSVVTWGDPSYGGSSSGISRLSSGVTQIFSNSASFAALKADGSVVTWGDPSSGGDSSAVAQRLSSGVTKIFSNGYAFAALKADGSVVTWGNFLYGINGTFGAISGKANRLMSGVTQVFSTWRAFAALKVDGSVVTWGDPTWGGDSSGVASQLSSGVSQIFSSYWAFAALKTDGSVVTWSDPIWNSNSSGVAAQLSSGVTQIFSTDFALAALKADGSVITWGSSSAGGDSSGVAGQLSAGVSQIFSTERAFAALKADGSVVTWGSSSYGGDSSGVADQLSSGVTKIFSTKRAFAALKADGSVITWGSSSYGGDSSGGAGQLSSGVSQLFSNNYAFAALKANGSVVAWGDSSYGGDSSGVANVLSSDVTHIFSTDLAFAALKANGTVVTWGPSYNSAVANQLTNVVAFANPFTDDRLVLDSLPTLTEKRAVGMEKTKITDLPTPELATDVSLRQGEDDRPLRAVGIDASSIDLGGRLSDQHNTVTVKAAVESATADAQAVGLDGSEMLLRPGDDTLLIEASATGNGPGVSIAIRNSFLSGNRGDDTITLRGNLWGDRAIVFGGEGNDRITGHGIGRDSFLQAGSGDDWVSLGRLETTPGALPLVGRDGRSMPVSTYRGGDGFDVLQLRETTQAVFEAEATWFTSAGESGWLFQGARFSGFEQINFG